MIYVISVEVGYVALKDINRRSFCFQIIRVHFRECALFYYTTMTRTEMLLVLLSEECVETSQRVSKALRFGLEEVQVGQTQNNGERIFYEFNDILAVMEVLYDERIFFDTRDEEAIKLKKDKIHKYLMYSEEMGTID